MRKTKIEDFIKIYFPEESYSKVELERTPLGVKIIIYTDRPGRIIGAGGRKINELTDGAYSRLDGAAIAFSQIVRTKLVTDDLLGGPSGHHESAVIQIQGVASVRCQGKESLPFAFSIDVSRGTTTIDKLDRSGLRAWVRRMAGERGLAVSSET